MYSTMDTIAEHDVRVARSLAAYERLQRIDRGPVVRMSLWQRLFGRPVVGRQRSDARAVRPVAGRGRVVGA